MVGQPIQFKEPFAGTCPIYPIEHLEETVRFDTGVSYEMTEGPSTTARLGAPHRAGVVDG